MNENQRTQPDLVMVGEEDAVPPQPGWGSKEFVVIFIRRDGWMLGSTAELSRTAYELWADEWTHVIFITPDEDEVQMTIRQFLKLMENMLRLAQIKWISCLGNHRYLQN